MKGSFGAPERERNSEEIYLGKWVIFYANSSRIFAGHARETISDGYVVLNPHQGAVGCD